MTRITIKDGKLSAEVYVQVTREYECECGKKLTITMSLPENVSYEGSINVNATCPVCSKPVVIPKGHHYIEGYKLLSK